MCSAMSDHPRTSTMERASMSRPPFEIIWAWDLWAWSIGGLSNKQRYRLDRDCYMIARENMDMRRQQMVGETYLERGNPVVVLARWGKGGGPRNVLIQREDGTRVIRPFRGLRKADWNVTDDYASPRTADRSWRGSDAPASIQSVCGCLERS
jgi:hypothetical protein